VGTVFIELVEGVNLRHRSPLTVWPNDPLSGGWRARSPVP
jgi:hypothetical protein